MSDNKNDILKVLLEEAGKPIEKDKGLFHEGLSRGKKEAYSHAYTLIKNLS